MTILIAFHQTNSRTFKHFYLKYIRQRLRVQGVNLVYKVRKTMQPLNLSGSDTVLLKKRMLIALVIRELKTQAQLAHTWHRSFKNLWTDAAIPASVRTRDRGIGFGGVSTHGEQALDELQQIKDLPLGF